MKKITGKEANKLINEQVFEDNDVVYVFDDVYFDYIESADEELDGVYACIVSDGNKEYYSPTDGISYDLVAEKYFLDRDDIYYFDFTLYIEENEFLFYFDELPREVEEIEFLKFAVEDDELVLLAKADTGDILEAKVVETLSGVYVFSFENDYLDRNFEYELTTEIRDFVLDNAIEAEYSRDEYCTRSFTIADYIILEATDYYDDNQKYEVILRNVHLDATGNAFFGGFYFKDYEIRKKLPQKNNCEKTSRCKR